MNVKWLVRWWDGCSSLSVVYIFNLLFFISHSLGYTAPCQYGDDFATFSTSAADEKVFLNRVNLDQREKNALFFWYFLRSWLHWSIPKDMFFYSRTILRSFLKYRFKIFASVQEARFRILMYHRFVEQRRNTTPAKLLYYPWERVIWGRHLEKKPTFSYLLLHYHI